MPTSYTADVQSGKITEFNDFAMSCARAFGACITMRDDPSSAVIQDEFAPSDYNAKALIDANAILSALEALTPDERQAAADADNDAVIKSWDDREAERAKQRERYEAMLEKVQAWAPPTSEHAGMKTFMIEQIVGSIKFDCSESYGKRPEPKSTADWYADALSRANNNISYHAKAQAEEIERALKKTKWVADLRASLAPQKSEAA
jgi:hypothetical protein